MPKIVFSSEQLPEHLDEGARRKLWMNMFTAHFCAAEISFYPDAPFQSRFESARFGDIGVTQLKANIRRAVRTKQHIASDTRGDYLIGSMLNGVSSLLKQQGREAVRGAGQAMLCTNTEPMDAWHEPAVAYRGASVPHKLLAERVADFEDLVIRPLAPSRALVHLDRYLSILINEEAGDDPALEQHIGAHLVDLIALSLGATGDSAELARMRGLRAARFREIVKEIKQGFSDPAFSAEAVSRRLGVSPRYIRDLLQESGVGLTERILELRLQQARNVLENSGSNRLKISEIALACGFNEVSHFNRCFRRRFGASPTQFRGRG
jgi:AraC-like DNA-binding protein